jgi:hypothetical protein
MEQYDLHTPNIGIGIQQVLRSHFLVLLGF